MAYLHHQIRAGTLKSFLGRDAALRDDRDDPARRRAGLNFLHRMHYAYNQRAVNGQRLFHSPILRKAAALRQFWIGRFERLHDGHRWSRYAKRFRDDPHDIREALTKILPTSPAQPLVTLPGWLQLLRSYPIIHFGVGPVLPGFLHQSIPLSAGPHRVGLSRALFRQPSGRRRSSIKFPPNLMG